MRDVNNDTPSPTAKPGRKEKIMLNYKVYYKHNNGEKVLRAMFAAKYEAEKYIEEWHKKDRTHWILEADEWDLHYTTEYLD